MSNIHTNNGEHHEGTPSIPHTNFNQHFWEGILSGRYEPPPPAKRDEWVEQYLLQRTPLTPLSSNEKDVITKMFRSNVDRMVNRDTLKAICEHPMLYLDASLKPLLKQHRHRLGYPSLPSLVDVGHPDMQKKFAVFSRQPLTPQEKLNLLADADRWQETEFREHGSATSLPAQGHRNLWSYGTLQSYLFQSASQSVQEQRKALLEQRQALLSQPGLAYQNIDSQLDDLCQAEFPHLLKRIKERTGKQSITMLDVGGGSGRALSDAKKIDPSITTHNLTIDEEPAMYPVDRTHFCPAEWMPKEFEENMDLIVSNMSIRYHTYPYITLENTVRALSVGGEAFFTVSCERSSTDEEKLKKNLFKAYAMVEKLVQDGYLSVECRVSTPFDSEEEDVSWFHHKENFDVYGYSMHMTKLKSLNPITRQQEVLRGRVRSLGKL